MEKLSNFLIITLSLLFLLGMANCTDKREDYIAKERTIKDKRQEVVQEVDSMIITAESELTKLKMDNDEIKREAENIH